jgi:MFS family permease
MTNPRLVSSISKIRHGWRQPSVLLPANTLVFGFFVGMIMVLVPLYMYANGYDIAEIGLVVAAQAVFQLSLRIVAGVVADRYGEQRVITTGYAFMLISALLFANSSALWPMIVAQLFTGASRAAYMPASKSYASRIHEKDAAVHLGRTLGGATFGSIVGPAVGGLLAAAIGFSGAFVVAAGVGGAGLVLSLLLPALPRHRTQTMRDALASVPALVRTKATLLPGLIAFFVASSIAVMASVGVVLLRDGVSSESTVGLIMGAYAVGATVSSFGFATVLNRLGARGTFALLFATIGLGMLSIALTHNAFLWTLLAVLFGAGMGLGAALYGLITAHNSRPHERGVAMAVAGLYWATGMLIGPLVYGALAEAIGAANAIITAAAFPLGLALLTPLVFAAVPPHPAPESAAA